MAQAKETEKDSGTTNSTLAALREKGEKAILENRFEEAIGLFDGALQLDRNDPALVRQRVLATYKAGQPDLIIALNNARSLLDSLSPEESTDRKTLELLGDIEFSLFEAGQGVNHLVSARGAYERLHAIKSDWRSGITLAELVVQHAEYRKNQVEKLADLVIADHLRRQVIQFGKERLAVISELSRMEDVLPKSLKTEDRAQEQSWVWCAIAEAYYGLGDNENYLDARDKAARSKGGGQSPKELDAKIFKADYLLRRQAKLRDQAEVCLAKQVYGEAVSVTKVPSGMQSLRSPEDAMASGEAASNARAVSSTMFISPDSAGMEIFISYAWDDESEEIANKLDKSFSARGLTIVRDKHDLGFKGSIRRFMERMGRGKCVLLVISDKYLKSENCLFELVQVAEHGDFEGRIFPLLLGSAQIYKPIDRIRYVAYWEEQIDGLDKAMKSVSQANLQGFREEIDQYEKFRALLPGLADILKDMNTFTVATHLESDFTELIDAVTAKLGE